MNYSLILATAIAFMTNPIAQQFVSPAKG